MIGGVVMITSVAYGAAKLIAIPVAALVVLAASGLLGAFWTVHRAPRRPLFSLLLGADGRLSTSITVAFAWTMIVTYVLVAFIIAAPRNWTAATDNVSPTYLLLLAGPFGALLLAKAITNGRLASGSLQKSVGDGRPRILDLFADDRGRIDLYDSMFVLLNIIAIGFVLSAFGRATLRGGFPSLPIGLALLTTLPAALYVANKAIASSQPIISTVTPVCARPGGLIKVLGANLAPHSPASGSVLSSGAAPDGAPGSGNAPNEAPNSGNAPNGATLEVGGVPARIVSWSDGMIEAAMPTPVATAIHVDVAVTISGSERITKKNAIAIIPPVIDGVGTGQSSVGDVIEVHGSWSDDHSIVPRVLIDGVAASIKGVENDDRIAVIVPRLSRELPADVEVWLVVGRLASNRVSLHVS